MDPLNATVLDDDVAGVAMSLINGIATYDNFGDALTAASYSLALTSEPLHDVTLSLSGLGAYAVADPASVTIAPEDWATPQVVTVAASAPSAARPVCPVADRFCAALGSGRNEVVAHGAASKDPRYDSSGGSALDLDLSSADVAVAVAVVHDAADPPSVTAGRFTDLLNGIVVELDSSSDRAGLTGTFDCSLLLNMTTDTATTLFGAAKSCFFSSPTTFKVRPHYSYLCHRPFMGSPLLDEAFWDGRERSGLRWARGPKKAVRPTCRTPA